MYTTSDFTHLEICLSIIILTTLLYTIQLIEKKINEKSFYDNVRTWTKGVDLFSQDYIIVPINLNGHWSLIVIIRPGLVKVCLYASVFYRFSLLVVIYAYFRLISPYFGLFLL